MLYIYTSAVNPQKQKKTTCGLGEAPKSSVLHLGILRLSHPESPSDTSISPHRHLQAKIRYKYKGWIKHFHWRRRHHGNISVGNFQFSFPPFAAASATFLLLMQCPPNSAGLLQNGKVRDLCSSSRIISCCVTMAYRDNYGLWTIINEQSGKLWCRFNSSNLFKSSSQPSQELSTWNLNAKTP